MQDDLFQNIQSLTDMTDVTDNITAPPILSLKEEGILHETTMILLDDYISDNIITMSHPKFHQNVLKF